MDSKIIRHSFWRIYRIKCLVTNKSYVGMTSSAIKRRWQGHICDAKKRRFNSYLHKAIRRYGVSAFSLELLLETDIRRVADAAERIFIAALGTLAPHGYNFARGGFGGATRMGRTNSPEMRRNISVALRGRKVDPAVVEKVAAKLRGRKLSPAHAAIIRVAGRKNRGRKHTLRQNLKHRIFLIKQSLLNPTGRSGVAGCEPQAGGRFRARIRRDGKFVSLGTFRSLEEAASVRLTAANEELQRLEALLSS